MCKYPSPVAPFVLPRNNLFRTSNRGVEKAAGWIPFGIHWHPDKFKFRAALRIAVTLARHASHLYSPFISIPISQTSPVKPSSLVHDYVNGGVIGFFGASQQLFALIYACACC